MSGGDPFAKVWPDTWRCPHHCSELPLAHAVGHIEAEHDECLMCSAERLLLLAIIARSDNVWFDAHPTREVGAVSE
jgi:hypothetical protein